MALIKPPYTVKLNGEPLPNVTNVDYEDSKLVIESLVQDLALANEYLDGKQVHKVWVIGCGKNEEDLYAGARYLIKSHTMGIVTDPSELMKIRFTFIVKNANFGLSKG